MTCRHAPGDPSCSSHPSNPRNPANIRARDTERELKVVRAQLDDAQKQLAGPDNSKYSILEAKEVNGHLVLKVQYPSCPECSFEGVKILVFLDSPAVQALQWRVIDPHFRPDKNNPHEAPSPAARFPATADGWNDALDYARNKSDILTTECMVD